MNERSLDMRMAPRPINRCLAGHSIAGSCCSSCSGRLLPATKSGMGKVEAALASAVAPHLDKPCKLRDAHFYCETQMCMVAATCGVDGTFDIL